MKRLTAMLILAVPVAANADPISILYSSDGSTIRAVQGSVLDSWSTNAPGEYALAVDGTIKTVTQRYSGAGSEYTVDGTRIGATSTGGGNLNLLDGATDGTYNYSVCYITACGGNVYRFDLDWSNPQLLFNTGDQASLGITFDPFTGSLWISSFTGLSAIDQVANFDLSGNLLGSFGIASLVNARGLAMDYADGTLWIANDARDLVQFTTAGSLLDSVFVNGGLGASQGLEANLQSVPVPEPSTLALLAVGLFGMGLARCRKTV